MVSQAMMALIEDNEGIVSDLYVAPAQAVEEHLRDHDSNSCLSNLI